MNKKTTYETYDSDYEYILLLGNLLSVKVDFQSLNEIIIES